MHRSQRGGRSVAGRMRTPEEPIDASRFRFAVVVASFNDSITSKLLKGAREYLAGHGDPSADEFWVPGAFELPLAAKLLASSGRYDAVVCLGAVIRGETPHFEFVAASSARGIQEAALSTGIPVAFGVVTTDDVAQAEARAGGAHGNKGWEAARTAVEMAAFAESLKRA